MKKGRVVITGLGVVTPIGTGTEKFWNAAIKGTSGVRPLKSIDTTDYRTKTGGEVIDFDAEKYLTTDEIKSMGRSSQLACAAAVEAVENAGLDFSKENLFRVCKKVFPEHKMFKYAADSILICNYVIKTELNKQMQLFEEKEEKKKIKNITKKIEE